MINCLIVDDEEMAIKVIESHAGHIKELEIVGTCQNAMEAFSILQGEQVDLLFLDIQMPKLSGLGLLRSLPKSPHVILTTAHREFALEGFELDVVDYLLKPISFDRFMKAAGKVFKLEQQNPPISINTEKPEAPAFFYVKSERQYKKILLDEVFYIESLHNHVKVVTKAENIITLLGIGQMEEKLPPQHFLRVHRSFIVSLSKVRQFSPTQIIIADQMIPIGSHYRDQVMQRLSHDML